MSGNVNENVTSTPAKILQGSGEITVDGVILGGYQGGVNVTYSQTEVFVESDWSLGPVDSETTGVELTVSTELEEATLENLAIAWGIHSSSVLSGTSSKILNIIPHTNMREVELIFQGMSATDRTKVRTFTCVKAVRIGSSSTVLNRGIKTTIPVTFKCLMGTDGSFGTIVDATLS